MTEEPRAKDPSVLPWMVAGVAVVVLLFTLIWHYQRGASPARELELKASRVDLVAQLQAGLASASEAEKSAVLAITDQESQAFADQARAATAAVERERAELDGLLASAGSKAEQDLLAQISAAFARLQQVDEQVLGLAVKNTNLKAYALAFGPAAEAELEFDAALSRVAGALPGGGASARAQALTFEARLALVRVQALFPPHIAEEKDARMDELEAAMTREEARVRQALAGLGTVPGLARSADLAAAGASLVRFDEVKARILALSRENTNVRSLALSLNEKRKALQVCLDALGALRQAILDEPIAGVTYGRPMRPR